MPTNLFPSNQQSLSAGYLTTWLPSQASAVTLLPDPLGGNQAVKLLDNTVHAQHYLLDSPYVAVADGSYTLQLYAKAGELTQTQIQFVSAPGSGPAGVYQIFDLSSGSIVGGALSYGTGVTFISSSIGTDAHATGAGGNGWYLLTLSCSVTGGGGVGLDMVLVKGGTTVYTGGIVNGTYFSTPVLFAGGIQYATAADAGVGSLTANVQDVDEITVRFVGTGGFALPVALVDVAATAAFVGTGGWTASPYQFDLSPVEAPTFNGVGGWRANAYELIPSTGVTFAGVGGLNISLYQFYVGPQSFSGVGGWLASPYQFDLSPVEAPTFNGVGTWAAWMFGTPPTIVDLFGAGGLTITLQDTLSIAPTFNGVGGWQLGSLPDIRTFYVAEDGGTFYVAEDNFTNYVTENSVEFAVQNISAEFDGQGGWLANFYQFNLSPIEAPFFVGAGGWTASPYQFDLSPVEAPIFNGVGGFTANVSNNIPITMAFNGAGGWQLPFLSDFNLTDTDYAAEDGTTLYVTEDGLNNYITEFTVVTGQVYVTEDAENDYVTEDGGSVYVPENYQPSIGFLFANFNGQGGWTLPYLVELGFPPISAFNWRGVGFLTVSLQATEQVYANWNGVGGWNANFISVQLPAFPIYASWNGVGGWTIDVIRAFIGPPIGYTVWNGVGSWLVDLEIVLGPQQNPPVFLLCDPVWRRLYSEPLTVGTPTTLLLNVGVPVSNPILTITRPDGSTYQPASEFVLVSKADFPSEIYFGIMPQPSFRAGQYVYYAFNGGEFNQAGTWTVSLQSSAGSVTMSFMVNNLNALALAA